MQKLIIKTVLFLLPVALILALPVSVSYLSGELHKVSEVIARQNKAQGLYGAAYSNSQGLYKIEKTKLIQPEVLVLGTSRTMQFRSFFFGASFYNAGGGVFRLSDFEQFMKKAYDDGSRKKPSVLIISLDQYFFNEAWNNAQSEEYKTGDVDAFSLNTLQEVTKDILAGRISHGKIKEILSGATPNTGLTAIVYGDGFRPDGSYLYNRIVNSGATPEELCADSYQRILNGNNRFEYGNDIADDELTVLDSLLSYCRNNGIHVVAYLPPYADAVWQKMLGTGKYGYMPKLMGAAEPLFGKYGFSLFDYSNIAWLGSPDDEIIDGFHGTEVTHLRMLIRMAKQDSILRKHVALPALENMLEATGNHYLVEQKTGR